MSESVVQIETIGNRIKKLRIHYELSLIDFSALCGVSSTTIHNYESGKWETPNIVTLYKIVELLGTTIDWLKNGNGEMLPIGIKNIYNEENEKIKFLQNEIYIQQKENIDALKLENERL